MRSIVGYFTVPVTDSGGARGEGVDGGGGRRVKGEVKEGKEEEEGKGRCHWFNESRLVGSGRWEE